MDTFSAGIMLLLSLGVGFIGGQATAKEPDIETMKSRIVAYRVREKLDHAERAKLDEKIEAETEALTCTSTKARTAEIDRLRNALLAIALMDVYTSPDDPTPAHEVMRGIANRAMGRSDE